MPTGLAPERVAPTEQPAGSRPVRRFWRVRRLEIAGAVVFLLFVAWPLLRPSRVVEGLDTYAYSAPNEAVSFDALRSWRLPQWNDTIFGGAPHFANPQVGLFNPLKWPFVPLDPWRAVVLITALHLLVLAIGMIVLAHRLRLRPPAGFVAAVALVGSGLVAGKSLQYPQITVVAGIPWLLAALDLALDRPSRPRRAVAWVALATAFIFVSGHPQMTMLAFALAAAWTLSRALRHRAWRRIWLVATGFALGAALAAVQLLPTLALLDGAAERAATFVTDPSYTLHRALLPVTLLGDVWAPSTAVLSGTFESMSFVGVAVAVAAFVGVVDTLRRPGERAATIVLLATGGIAVLLAQGGTSPVYRLASDVIPLFKEARVPARWIIVVTILAAILAAMGTDAAVDRRIDRRLAIALGATAAGVLLVVGLLAVGPLALPGAKTVVTWFVLAALTGGALWLVARAPRAWAIAGLVVLLTAMVLELGSMARHGPLRDTSVPAAITSTSGRAVDYLEAHPRGRVLAATHLKFDDPEYMIEGLRVNVNSLFGIRSIDGYDGGPQVRAGWVEAATALTDGPVLVDLTLAAQAAVPLDPALYARYGVRYALIETSVVPASQFVPGWGDPVTTSGSVQLFENPSYVGDASVYHRTRPATEHPGKVLRRMDPDERSDVALVGPDGPRLDCEMSCDREPAVVRRDGPEHLVVRASTRRSALLAIAEQYDDGWSAEIDGEPVDVFAVDGFMLGVRLPAGSHTIDLRYRAPGLRAGIVVSLLAAAAVVALLVIDRRRIKGHATPAADQSGDASAR